MIVRKNERCPNCGRLNPWRVYSTHVVNGVRVQYVSCRGCGHRETIVYRD